MTRMLMIALVATWLSSTFIYGPEALQHVLIVLTSPLDS